MVMGEFWWNRVANNITAQEEVRSHQPAPPQEEVEIDESLPSASGESGDLVERMRRLHATDMKGKVTSEHGIFGVLITRIRDHI